MHVPGCILKFRAIEIESIEMPCYTTPSLALVLIFLSVDCVALHGVVWL